ncbi:MAG: hypothetical protein EAZ27_04915 [Cytophagales bacterium]|nr:MAG: hypothetical protein EAZ27_04915 [Cytophagales bacterium]
MKGFQNPRDPENIEITKKVKEWVMEKFTVSDISFISINEISCSDGCCPNSRTQILVLGNYNFDFLIGKPLTYIRKWDIVLLNKS